MIFLAPTWFATLAMHRSRYFLDTSQMYFQLGVNLTDSVGDLIDERATWRRVTSSYARLRIS
jgi:hypothetical protein